MNSAMPCGPRAACLLLLPLIVQCACVFAFVSSPGRFQRQASTTVVSNRAGAGQRGGTLLQPQRGGYVCRIWRPTAAVMMAKSYNKGKGKKKEERMELIQSVAAAEGLVKRDGQWQEEDEGEEGEATARFNVDKLRAETKTPFRTLRVFIYGGFGFSAFVGGLTALGQLAATLGGQEGSLELSQVLINLLVDFGVMAVAAFCYNFETSQQEELEEAMAAARENKKRLQATKITEDVNAKRVEQLRRLSVQVPGSDKDDGSGPRKAPVGVLMDEAKQGFCILAGSREYLRDSMISAMLSKNQIFPSLNLLVVPVEMSVGGGEGVVEGPLGRGGGPGGGIGFAKAMTYEEEGYVAEPANADEWKDVMREELEAARRQGATKVAAGDDGIVLLISRKGKVLRRGVGVPIWKTIRDDVDPPKKKAKK